MRTQRKRPRRGGRHRHREHVVGQQRHAGDLRRQQAEVVARDHVRATGRRVLLDRLAVREDQEEQHDEHRRRDRHDEAEGGGAHRDDQHPQDLLGGVGRRGDAVGREDGERGRDAEPLVFELVGVQRRAEDLVLDPVATRLRNVDFGRRWQRPRRGLAVADGFGDLDGSIDELRHEVRRHPRPSRTRQGWWGRCQERVKIVS